MRLNKNKPTTSKTIPAKILKTCNDICAGKLTKIYNDSKESSNFPEPLKMADITPAHKKDETTNKRNYRPVSILPAISKIHERDMYNQINKYMNTHLSSYLCGFRKGYSAQHCLMMMLERWRNALDDKLTAGALLTDLSKAFDCLHHGLLIAKLEAYGFEYSALKYIYSYLSNRKQRTKVNSSFSEWSDIISGIPQGSILGPLLFNIYINDLFYFVNETELANYADDNTPYAIDIDTDSVINTLENDADILIRWFRDNYMKLNEDKCHFLITDTTEKMSMYVGTEKIESSDSVKLLGITFDNKLKFEKHIPNICNKVSHKLHALARISNYMTSDKLQTIMKAFIESQFGYCPLIWMFHSRNLNNRINRLHERGLSIVYKDRDLSYDELLEKDRSFSVHHRNLQKLATEIRGPKTWELVPDNKKKAKSLLEFKSKIKIWKPVGCTCRLCKAYIPNIGFI